VYFIFLSDGGAPKRRWGQGNLPLPLPLHKPVFGGQKNSWWLEIVWGSTSNPRTIQTNRTHVVHISFKWKAQRMSAYSNVRDEF